MPTKARMGQIESGSQDGPSSPVQVSHMGGPTIWSITCCLARCTLAGGQSRQSSEERNPGTPGGRRHPKSGLHHLAKCLTQKKEFDSEQEKQQSYKKLNEGGEILVVSVCFVFCLENRDLKTNYLDGKFEIHASFFS